MLNKLYELLVLLIWVADIIGCTCIILTTPYKGFAICNLLVDAFAFPYIREVFRDLNNSRKK